MYLIVKNLDPENGVELIENIINSKNRILSHASLHLRAIIILGVEDGSGKIIEYHGLIRIDSDRYKTQIKKLLRSRIKTSSGLSVADFHIRHWSQDKRQSGVKQPNIAPNKCRRVSDRRRTQCNIIKVREKTYD